MTKVFSINNLYNCYNKTKGG